jgi:hypothetical protein
MKRDRIREIRSKGFPCTSLFAKSYVFWVNVWLKHAAFCSTSPGNLFPQIVCSIFQLPTTEMGSFQFAFLVNHAASWQLKADAECGQQQQTAASPPQCQTFC